MKLYQLKTSMTDTYIVAQSADEAIELFDDYSKDYRDSYRIVNSIKIVATDVDYEAKEGVSFLIITKKLNEQQI